MNASAFVMSVEYAALHSRLEGDLPSDLDAARQVIVERYAVMIANDEPVYTIAIMRSGKLVDVFDGRDWSSEFRFACDEDG